MASLTQENLPLTVTTPLGGDAFIATGFRGEEGISRLFEFEVDLLALSSTTVDFGSLLGQNVTTSVLLGGGEQRIFSGIAKRVLQGAETTLQDGLRCTTFRVEIVPRVWLLTRNVRSRVFQQLSVPDILKKVFEGFDVAYEIQGTFQPRNYCVQYRESDFDFVSRLMEEEGIYYLFKHAGGQHKLVLANSPASHPSLPTGDTIAYEPVGGGLREEGRIQSWEKQQELRTGKYQLWDHSFELPSKNLEASAPIVGSVQAGAAAHKLKVGANDSLEIYDYPGDYAKRFDGVAPGGGDRASDLQKIFEDNVRTAKIRMQAEESGSVWIRGTSNCRQMIAGHKFTLENYGNANGSYILTSVSHRSELPPAHRTGAGAAFSYENSFVCVPEGLPFRPQRTTERPRVAGCQTATVVGPSGEEIFTDKYGRVKVQFHWDREGKKDEGSSCWLRVASTWAGKNWGAIHIPRIGQEVLVDFLEGDPDRPIIVGSVYNADHMPPYELPANKTQSGIKSRSTPNGTAETFNEIRFEDKKGEEQVYVHAEKNLRVNVERNEARTVGQHMIHEINGARGVAIHGEAEVTFEEEFPEDGEVSGGSEMVGDFLEVDNNRYVYVGKSMAHEVVEDYSMLVSEGNATITLETGNHILEVEQGDQSITIDKGDQTMELGQGDQVVDIKKGNQEITVALGDRMINVDLGKITEEAMQGIELKVGSNSIKIDQTGVTIKGMMIKIEADTVLQVKGSAMAQVEGGGMLTLKGGITMIN